MAVKILIPYNFTLNDEKSIEFAGQRYAREKDVKITLFHAFTPVPEIDTRNNPVMEKIIRNTSYLRSLQNDQKEALKDARQKLMKFGFDGQNIYCLYMPIRLDIADDIIKLWKDENFDMVILNRNPGNIINYFSRSISKRITRYIKEGKGVHIVN